MSEDSTGLLLASNLKPLKLPTILAERGKLAREASGGNASYAGYLLRLTELELCARRSSATEARIRRAQFPMQKELDTYDFSLMPSVPRQVVLELSRGEWIGRRGNVCLIGSPGTGKTHLATALGRSACRRGKRVRSVTAAALVNQLEAAQKAYQLERMLAQPDRVDLLICDEVGYLSFGRSGAELLFQVLAERYERRSVLVTSNLGLSEWKEVFVEERLTAALLDRLTHHCEIVAMNGESYRFRQSAKGLRPDQAK
jgi:DNA replication protein DnaC